jgi:SulP family sulfate permease
MRQSGFDKFLGEDHFLAQEEAIDYLFETVVDPARCWYQCEHRVFAECQALTKKPIEIDLPHMKYTPIDPARRLDPDQVQELIANREPVVIDVREPDEYHHGHFPEARLLPLSELLTSQPDLPRDRPILLICRTGRRSKRAMRFLMDLGYEDLQNLRGGVLSWKALDLPLEVD